MKKLLPVLLLLTCLNGIAQNAKRIIVARQDPHDLYANFDKDSTTLFYDIYLPKGKPLGALAILPGAGEPVDVVKKQITLHTLAVQQGLVVIIPSINWGTNKHVPEHQLLDTIFRQLIQNYQVPKDKFVVGGFSGGGMLALTYTQKANREPGSTVVKPKAVFGVDPPLDYAHLWNHCEKDIQRKVSDVAVQESKMIMDSYIQEFGGPPEKNREAYVRHSIFSYDQADGGNARYLVDTPVLLFTEPDITWQMKNRQRDYYDLNCVDIAAMINLLQIKGNKEAQLVVTQGKGRRLNGQKHPHSWSIMDSKQCLDWVLKQLAR